MIVRLFIRITLGISLYVNAKFLGVYYIEMGSGNDIALNANLPRFETETMISLFHQMKDM